MIESCVPGKNFDVVAKSEFSNVSRWLDDMTKLDGHDDSHLVLKELGDISQGAPEMERIMGANMKGIEIVNKKIAEM